MQPYNLATLHTHFSKYTAEIVLYLPRTSDLNQLARYARSDGDGDRNGKGKKKLEVAHYALMGASKVCDLTCCLCISGWWIGRSSKRLTRLCRRSQALCVYFGNFDFDVDGDEGEGEGEDEGEDEDEKQLDGQEGGSAVVATVK